MNSDWLVDGTVATPGLGVRQALWARKLRSGFFGTDDDAALCFLRCFRFLSAPVLAGSLSATTETRCRFRISCIRKAAALLFVVAMSTFSLFGSMEMLCVQR